MSVTRQHPDSDVDPLPDELDSPRAKLIYLYLDAADGGTLSEIQATLDVSKLSLLSVLDALSGRGLIERDGDQYLAL